MHSIEIIPDKGGCDVILLKDGKEVVQETEWFETAVEIAFRTRELTEKFLLKEE